MRPKRNRLRDRHSGAGGPDEACNLLRALLLHAQKHEKCAQLLGQHRAVKDHAHGLLRFLDGQRPRKRLAASKDLHKPGERVRRAYHTKSR